MIEYLAPGVYVVEVPFVAHPIDGVSTCAAPPDWTGHNDSDPGVALVPLCSWIAESLAFRTDVASSHLVLQGQGVVGGLEVADDHGKSDVKIAPGLALRRDGHAVEWHRAVALLVTRPDPPP